MLESQVAYCPHCEKDIHVAVTPAPEHATHANVPDGGELVCLDVGEACEGIICPLSGKSTLMMGVRLARAGEEPVEGWPHVDVICEGCGAKESMEVLDGTHAFCPRCKTTNTVMLIKMGGGTYRAVGRPRPDV